MMRKRSAGKSYKMATGGAELVDDEFVQVVMRRPQRANTASPVGGGIFNSLQRRKKSTRTGPSRRVSCADLGRGTHQGWIYTRKPRKTTWEKTTKWCVLKDANLFIYASQRDNHATSRIYLPSFKVTDAKKETKKTGAFKVYNEGTAFFFKCKSEEESHEWINHLSLAAIGFDTQQVDLSIANSASTGSSGFSSASSANTSGDWSDEDDDDTSSIDDLNTITLRKKTSQNSIAPPSRIKSVMDSNDAMRSLVTSIHAGDLNMMGENSERRRQSNLRKSMGAAGFSRQGSGKNNKNKFIKRAKERQKQALEHELTDIETLLKDVSRLNLYNFLSRYPDYQDTISECSSLFESSAAESDSEDYQEMPADFFTSITSTTTIVPCDLDNENNELLGAGDDFSRTARNTLVVSTCESEDMNSGGNNRDTLTLFCDHTISNQVAGMLLEPPDDRHSRSASPVFDNGEKYDQSVTTL